MSALPAWAPTDADVGAIIARLIPDASGRVTGTFTDTTIPTFTQVTAIIASVAAEVTLFVPSVPDEVADAAKRCTAFGAALQVAGSFFPEVSRDYLAELRADYLETRDALGAAAARALTHMAGAMAVNRLPLHNLRPLPPYYGDQYYNPYVDPYWPY